MQGNDFSQYLNEIRQQVKRLQHGPGASASAGPGLQDPLQHLQGSIEQLLAACLGMLEHHEELLALRADIEAIRWRHDQIVMPTEGVTSTTVDGTIQECDSAAAALLGSDRRELPGRPLQEFLAHADRTHFGSLVEQVIQEGRVTDWQAQIRPERGDPVDTFLSATAVQGSDGQIVAIRWLLRNISSLKQAERQLGESEERYRSLVEMSPDGLFVQCDGRIVFANRALALILGAPHPQQLEGRPVLEMVHPDYRQTVQKRIEMVRNGQPVPPIEKKLLRLDGSEVLVEAAAVPVHFRGEPAIQCVCRDIGERKRLQEEVVAISEMERSRIGRDLHDVVGQTLAGISFLGKVLEKKLQEQGLSTAEPQEIIALAGEGIRQTRALARGLFEVEIAAEQFLSAMKAMSMDAQHLYGLGCRFDYPRDRQVIRDSRTATHLYHITQEALTNAVKHGRAKTIQIRLEHHAGSVVLEIRDNGVGFADARQMAGIGLRIMQHRASLIGASLRIDSTPGQGTTITCTIPPGTGSD